MEKVTQKTKLKPYEILFLIAGLGILISLPWIETGGLNIWLIAKLAYALGIVFFIIDLFKK